MRHVVANGAGGQWACAVAHVRWGVSSAPQRRLAHAVSATKCTRALLDLCWSTRSTRARRRPAAVRPSFQQPPQTTAAARAVPSVVAEVAETAWQQYSAVCGSHQPTIAVIDPRRRVDAGSVSRMRDHGTSGVRASTVLSLRALAPMRGGKATSSACSSHHAEVLTL